jgi:hypothetical protein
MPLATVLRPSTSKLGERMTRAEEHDGADPSARSSQPLADGRV